VINDNDLVGILVNATSCFSGIAPRTSVSGKLVPEQGMSAIIGFTTPSTYTDTIIDLQ
jgi:flagellin FlaB